METDINPQAVDNFLKIVRNAQSKQDFMSKAKQFDQRFVDAYPAPSYSQHNYPPSIPKSTSNSNRQNSRILENTNQIRNPFVNPQQEYVLNRCRKIRQTNPFKASNQVKQQPIQSRSQQNFYKNQDNSYMRDYYEQMNLNNYGQNTYGDQVGMYKPSMINANTIQSNYNFAQMMNSGPLNNQQQYVQPNSQQYIPQSPQFLGQQNESKSGSNFYPQGQIPQQNEYISNLEQQPQYVQYYKKMVPPHAPQQKVYTPTQRSNPFKNN